MFIRHAQSEFNIASSSYRQKHDIGFQFQEYSKDAGYMNGVKYNPTLIDSPLTQKGIEQCKQAKDSIDKVELDLILVSPLERALQTCDLIFKDRNVPIIAEPVLAEALRSACDISGDLQSKIERYPKVDFSPTSTQLYYIKNDSQQNQQKYMKAIEEKKATNCKERCEAVLQLMRETWIYEEPLNVRKRVGRVKQMLSGYRQKYNKIGVVSHYCTINYTACSKFKETNEPDDFVCVDNCEIYEANLEELKQFG